ncbi:2-amino-4-hydroxy-6-hydroxymethyldihydropteridine diphosphokinase [Prevotella sp. oral taxon 472 str. F0295]|jgi:2-amino-4-hydroxy-6-hydroxymethyldihydropteridine diphosphokinase|nr:2-amino-4-hydroxy-6-hydroxymethyldihydropteridine diphosphokinase [Prevotella sp. oral taxon 472]EEX54372.1 2-amino-4-hydroxy-6-hydroxymethyldihydropteridine diphosphokinase [Prevotella sp. oral taxon 472 str. F0295]
MSLGANLGDRKGNIKLAIKQISELIGPVVRQSALIETAPWGFNSANTFINAAVCSETSLSPREVLQATQGIERALGRTTKSIDGQYHDRLIDIDILLYDDLHVNEPGLVIPHPHMNERQFVMQPLSEIID